MAKTNLRPTGPNGRGGGGGARERGEGKEKNTDNITEETRKKG